MHFLGPALTRWRVKVHRYNLFPASPPPGPALLPHPHPWSPATATGSPSTHTWFLTADVCPQQTSEKPKPRRPGSTRVLWTHQLLWGHRGREGEVLPADASSHKGGAPWRCVFCPALPSWVSWTHQTLRWGLSPLQKIISKNSETYTTGVPIVVHATVKMVLKFVSF